MIDPNVCRVRACPICKTGQARERYLWIRAGCALLVMVVAALALAVAVAAHGVTERAPGIPAAATRSTP